MKQKKSSLFQLYDQNNIAVVTVFFLRFQNLSFCESFLNTDEFTNKNFFLLIPLYIFPYIVGQVNAKR